MEIGPSQVVEHFYGVYLLYCKNPKFKGRTYIGYTTNPRRRINQHNKGKKSGGAWRTSNRGPWVMVLTVHGFPNSISALRFEWAWQHPHLSRRLRHVPKKKANQKTFEYLLEVLSEMLKVGPWTHLPLTLRWLDDEFGEKYSAQVRPPLHMPITFGKVSTKKIQKTVSLDATRVSAEDSQDDQLVNVDEEVCHVCLDLVEKKERVTCVIPGCNLVSHLICLAQRFTSGDMILPVEGQCPVCGTNVLWGDLIRKKIGCKMHHEEEDDGQSDSSSFSFSDDE